MAPALFSINPYLGFAIAANHPLLSKDKFQHNPPPRIGDDGSATPQPELRQVGLDDAFGGTWGRGGIRAGRECRFYVGWVLAVRLQAGGYGP
uniref:Uncharacterized protein n=1 Tax=Ascaris lumbricoides TaxID=6252 RepID=A0A0M3HXM4_ASCLU